MKKERRAFLRLNRTRLREAKKREKIKAGVLSGSIPICHKDMYGLYWVEGIEGKYLEGGKVDKVFAFCPIKKRVLCLRKAGDDEALAIISSYLDQYTPHGIGYWTIPSPPIKPRAGTPISPAEIGDLVSGVVPASKVSWSDIMSYQKYAIGDK